MEARKFSKVQTACEMRNQANKVIVKESKQLSSHFYAGCLSENQFALWLRMFFSGVWKRNVKFSRRNMNQSPLRLVCKFPMHSVRWQYPKIWIPLHWADPTTTSRQTYFYTYGCTCFGIMDWFLCKEGGKRLCESTWVTEKQIYSLVTMKVNYCGLLGKWQ